MGRGMEHFLGSPEKELLTQSVRGRLGEGIGAGKRDTTQRGREGSEGRDRNRQ